mmetsp:Transcript_8117/g.18819  ORF Transcript_8117/g.18819 Transcript_8117/m.18819 type:complete len:200 (+) Transcript_8117:365-964(+)
MTKRHHHTTRTCSPACATPELRSTLAGRGTRAAWAPGRKNPGKGGKARRLQTFRCPTSPGEPMPSSSASSPFLPATRHSRIGRRRSALERSRRRTCPHNPSKPRCRNCTREESSGEGPGARSRKADPRIRDPSCGDTETASRELPRASRGAAEAGSRRAPSMGEGARRRRSLTGARRPRTLRAGTAPSSSGGETARRST